MHHDIVFSGFGGQGVMFSGQLLAYAAMDEGLHVTWIPSYGPEMRGGTAHCFVVVSSHAVSSPVVQHPSVAVLFNRPSYAKYAPEVAAGGVVLTNSCLVTQEAARADIRHYAVPATTLAEALGSPKIANLVLLGALLEAAQILPVAALEAALERHLPAHRRNLLEANYRALEAGATFIQSTPGVPATP